MVRDWVIIQAKIIIQDYYFHRSSNQGCSWCLGRILSLRDCTSMANCLSVKLCKCYTDISMSVDYDES